MHIANSIWGRLVPRNLRKQYTRCTRAAQQARFAPHSQNIVGHMLESVMVDTRGMRHTKARISSSVFLRYKNAEKCRLLLNAVRINASDHRAPKAVRLPTLSHLAHTIKGSRSGRWLCKIDLQNCYWSIKLPRSWRRVFVVQAGRHRYKYTRLPFGWCYSPSICQTLVKRLVASAISAAKVPMGNKVYLDDVLLDAKSRHSLNIGRRAVVHKLRQAGFIMSVKSETRPRKRIGFVGKWFDTLRKCANTYKTNRRFWLGRFTCGLGQWARERSLPLTLCAYWAACNGSSAQLLSPIFWLVPTGPHTQERIGSPEVLSVPQPPPSFFPWSPSHASPGRHKTAEYILLMQPLLPLTAPGTPIRVVGPKGCYRSRRCPPWVTTLAQAELYGLYTAAKIAAYEGHGTACIGVDSDTARYQAIRQRATTHCHVQNRLLRRLF